MHIHDFHSKFAAPGEEGCLFTALRNLSQVDDVSAVFDGDPAGILIDWLPWNPAENSAASGVSPRA